MGSLGEPLLPEKSSPFPPLSPSLPLLDAPSLVASLRAEFMSGRTRSIEWRLGQLAALERMLKEGERELVAALQEDCGKPAVEAFLVDVYGPIKASEQARKNLKKWMQPRKVPTNAENSGATSWTVPEPLGAVLIIGPFNFPIILLLEPLVGALAAGNVAILKPSDKTPATSAALAALCPKFLDPSAVRVVEGGIPETNALLEQKWDHIFYTGNTTVGKIVMAAASRHLTPVTLELGGKNPVVLDSSVDLRLAALRLGSGRCFNAGQLCVAPDYVLALDNTADAFVEELKKVFTEFYGEENSVCKDMCKIVNKFHLKRLEGYLVHPETKKCVVYGGQAHEKQNFFSPTILKDVPWDAPIMEEEVFGPIITVQPVRTLEEAIKIINERPKPLTLHVFSNTKSSVDRVIAETSSGSVVVNECILQLGNKDLPFGGVGDSGMGKYYGKTSFDTFSHLKSVFKKKLFKDISFRFPPYTRQKELIIRAGVTGDFWGLLMVLLGFRK